MLHEQELDYEWLCADGGVDFVCWMKLGLSVDVADDKFEVNRLLTVECDRAEIRAKVGKDFNATKFTNHLFGRSDYGLTTWLCEAFRNQHDIGWLNLNEDVREAAREQFGRLLHEVAK